MSSWRKEYLHPHLQDRRTWPPHSLTRAGQSRSIVLASTILDEHLEGGKVGRKTRPPSSLNFCTSVLKKFSLFFLLILSSFSSGKRCQSPADPPRYMESVQTIDKMRPCCAWFCFSSSASSRSSSSNHSAVTPESLRLAPKQPPQWRGQTPKL